MGLYNIEAEQNILGAILIDPESITHGNDVNFCADDLFDPKQTIIHKCMKKPSDTNSQIDPITVGNELKKEDMLEKIAFYLSHESERLSIAQRGFSKVHQNFSYEIQVKKMLEKLY